jgi:hypothetical protein
VFFGDPFLPLLHFLLRAADDVLLGQVRKQRLEPGLAVDFESLIGIHEWYGPTATPTKKSSL